MALTHPQRWAVAMLPPAVAVAGAGSWLLRRFDPNSADSPFPGCVFHAFTGLYCVGCGMTRSLHALVHGDLPAALAMNPLTVVLVAALPLLWMWLAGWRPAALQRLVAVLPRRPVVWITALSAFWVARNLPWPPFSWLAPGSV